MSLMVGLCALVACGVGCHSKNLDINGFDDDLSLEGMGSDGTYSLPGARIEDGIRINNVSFDSVMFNYDSFQIADSEIFKIEQVAEYLRNNKNVRLVVEGNCDERGSREYNISLGENRALAVRAHMVGIGIDSDRIQTRSYGEENPIDAGHDEAAWRANRRVEFALYR
jgi:peptidoglycan-associated lipoprotein